MLEVVKRALDRFTEPKQNEDFTHVIYTKGEHNKKNREISELEANIKNLEREYNAAIERYKKSANDKIAEYKARADGRVVEAHAERDKHKQKADDFENANANLIRIATERANAKRGLSPKKEHIGYVFLTVEEYTYNCQCYISEKSNKTKTLKLPCFRVYLQSPYQVNFDLDAVKTLIANDFKSKNVPRLLGIVLNFNINDWYEQELINVWNESENFDFKTSYKANFQKGFWEIELLTRFMVNIPPVMIKD